jgi:transketolase
MVPLLQKPNASLKPRVIIFHTIKGKGVKAFEGDPAWHARKIKGEEMEIGRKELGLA